MSPARCAASASASCRATVCAASCRRTTSTARASSTATARTARAMRELALIEALEQVLRHDDPRVVRWLGDDAAVVRAGGFAVTSVDTMVEGIHFPALSEALGTLA